MKYLTSKGCSAMQGVVASTLLQSACSWKSSWRWCRARLYSKHASIVHLHLLEWPMQESWCWLTCPLMEEGCAWLPSMTFGGHVSGSSGPACAKLAGEVASHARSPCRLKHFWVYQGVYLLFAPQTDRSKAMLEWYLYRYPNQCCEPWLHPLCLRSQVSILT